MCGWPNQKHSDRAGCTPFISCIPGAGLPHRRMPELFEAPAFLIFDSE